MNLYACDKFDWQRLVIETEGIPQVTKLVALTLSWYANRDGTSCHPGAERLAVQVGLSERRLRDHLAVLRDDLQLINRTARGGGRGRRLADVYQLVVPELLPDLVANYLDKHRTPRCPTYRAETPDAQVSDVTTETPDVEANTPDVGEETPDVETPNTGRPGVRPPRLDTSHLFQGASVTCGTSTSRADFGVSTAEDQLGHDDEDQLGHDDETVDYDAVAYGAAREVLSRLAPEQQQVLLERAQGELGPVDTRKLIEHAAQMVGAA